jgi:hypothetical protein
LYQKYTETIDALQMATAGQEALERKSDTPVEDRGRGQTPPTPEPSSPWIPEGPVHVYASPDAKYLQTERREEREREHQ